MATPSKECYYCGYDISECGVIFSVKVYGRWPTSSKPMWSIKEYEYCSMECVEDHDDERVRESEKAHD